MAFTSSVTGVADPTKNTPLTTCTILLNLVVIREMVQA